jgi:hypothetical protein
LFKTSYGVLVVSGGVVLEVSFTAVSAGGVVTVEESTTVLSDEPDTFFVELHAEAANIIEPAKARLKIVLFIMSSIYYTIATIPLPYCLNYFLGSLHSGDENPDNLSDI